MGLRERQMNKVGKVSEETVVLHWWESITG